MTKDFASLNHQFLFKVLHAFHFGSSLIKCIWNFYNTISSYVMNNSFTTNYFAVGCEVRQGDPLSPLLILSFEALECCCIRPNKKNQLN